MGANLVEVCQRSQKEIYEILKDKKTSDTSSLSKTLVKQRCFFKKTTIDFFLVGLS